MQYSEFLSHASQLALTTDFPLLFPSFPTGSINLPAVAVGMLVGGVIMKRVGLSLKTIPRFSVVMLTFSTLLCVPLFFMGCPTQQVNGVNHYHIGQNG